MLVITRKIGETVWLNDDIKVHVLKIDGNQVRLGFEAPPDIKIHRKEIYKAIKNGTHK